MINWDVRGARHTVGKVMVLCVCVWSNLKCLEHKCTYLGLEKYRYLFRWGTVCRSEQPTPPFCNHSLAALDYGNPGHDVVN